MRKYRLGFYLGIAVLAFGMSALAPSALSSAILGGALLYLTVSLVGWLAYLVLRSLTKSNREDRIAPQLSASIGAVGTIVLGYGLATSNPSLAQLGVAIILMSLEYFLQPRRPVAIG